MLTYIKQYWKTMLWVIAVVGIVFGCGVANDFVAQDYERVLGYKLIQSFNNTYRFFVDYVPTYSQEGIYAPLRTVWTALQFACWRHTPNGYHMIGIILHVLGVLVVYGLAKEFFKKHAYAIIAATLYAVHPAHVSTVSYIAGSLDLPGQILALWAFLLYVRDPDRRVSVFFLTALALLFSEAAVGIIGVFVVYELFNDTSQKKERVWALWPLVGVVVGYGFLKWLSTGTVIPGTLLPFWENVVRVAATDIGCPQVSVVGSHMVLAVGSIIALCVLIGFAFRKNAAQAAVFLSFIVMSFFVSFAEGADRLPIFSVYSVFGIVGTVFSFMLLLPDGETASGFKKVMVMVVLVGCVLAGQTLYLTTKLKNNGTLYLYLKNLAPHNAEYWRSSGYVLLERGQLDLAEDMFEQAVLLRGGAQDYIGLAEAQAMNQKLQAARISLEKAASINPQRNEAYINKVLVFFEMGNDNAAEKSIQEFFSVLSQDKKFYEIGKYSGVIEQYLNDRAR